MDVGQDTVLVAATWRDLFAQTGETGGTILEKLNRFMIGGYRARFYPRASCKFLSVFKAKLCL